LLDAKSTERQVFLGCENDARALCFADGLDNIEDEIHRAADRGDAYAQALMAKFTGSAEDQNDEAFKWAQNLLLKENGMVFVGLLITIPSKRM
jgi:hypothetical protein